MRLKHLCIILCLFCTNAVFAQNNSLSIYPIVGVNLSSLTKGTTYFLDDGTSCQYRPEYAIGFNIGGELEKKIQRIGLSLGLIFSLEQIKYKDIYVSSESYRFLSKDFSAKNKNLDVPLSVSYDIWDNKDSRICLKSGLLLRYLLNGTTKSTVSFYKKENNEWIINNIISGYNKQDFTYGYNRVQLAIPVGVSYEYKKIYMDLRYNIGLTNVYKYSDENIYNRSFVLSVGYSITV